MSAAVIPAAPDSVAAGVAAERWSIRTVVALAAVLLIGIAARVALLPTPGFRGDMDQFVGWVHGIAVGGLANAYDLQLAFPPVITYIWAALAAVEPAFRTATDASDVGIRILMKLPASIADIGLALVVAYALRDRPRWAVVGAAVILLHPAVIDVSAWWGQYESIYLLFALAAAVLAVNGRNGWAAAAIAVSLMTKPQALPLLVPFAAWFLATGGWREVLRAGVIGLTVIVVLWLPFIPAGGPAGYLRGVAAYQGEQFSVLSLWAWNPWWLIQEVAGRGIVISDNVPFIWVLTPRHVGYLITGLLEVTVGLLVLRDPQPRTLILGLAASVLIAFSFLTGMHERYSYGALIFLALLIPDRRLRVPYVALGIVITLNLLAAVSPTPAIGAMLRSSEAIGLLGAMAMMAITVATCARLTVRQGYDAST